MNIVEIVTVPARRAPMPNGPTVRQLFDIDSNPDSAPQVAILSVTLPVGGCMPEHDHGPSRVILIPTQGQLRLRQGEHEHSLSPGTATDIGVGERVSLTNSGLEPATLLVVATPPDFAAALSTWPPA